MFGNHRCAQTPFGFYYQNQPSSEAPAFFISLQEARDRKLTKRGWFINDGQDFRSKGELEPDNRDKLAGGSMRDSWHIAESDCYPVWQMYPIGEVIEENAS